MKRKWIPVLFAQTFPITFAAKCYNKPLYVFLITRPGRKIEYNYSMSNADSFNHIQVTVNDYSVHVVEAGNNNQPVILFLHGYPENWLAFESIMELLKDDFHVMAIDLPGIGKSASISGSDKKTIAQFVNSLIQQLHADKLVLIGHDVGGMIVFAMLKYFPQHLSKVVIMNTAVPGVAPWEEVKRNPHIWHFAFYAVPSLPEVLTYGKQRMLFDYFYDTLSADKKAISEAKRNAYARAYKTQESLKTSFDWYRAFPQDEKDNADKKAVDIPVLYIRGERDPGNMDDYVKGFQNSGIQNITAKLIPGSGHFSAEEQPVLVAGIIKDFVKSSTF